MDKHQLTFDPLREDFKPYGFTCNRWRPDRMSRADRHNEIELNLTVASTLTYLIGGRRETVPCGHLAVFWAATPHQIIEFADDSAYYVATIPLAWFLGWNLPGSFTQDILSGRLIAAADNSRGPDDARLFAQWTEDFSRSDAHDLRAATLEMEARLRRFAGTYGAAAQGRTASLEGHRPEALSKIEQMAAWIAQHYTEPVALKDVGVAAGLHPNYAAGLYQKAFGTTINASIVAHRIAHAQRKRSAFPSG